MIEGIVRFSVRHKLMVFLFTFTIAGFGFFALSRIPVNPIPDISYNQIKIITTAKNLSSLDVETVVTTPIEMEVSNLPGVEAVNSVSRKGMSLVTLTFDEKTDRYRAFQLVSDKIDHFSWDLYGGKGKSIIKPGLEAVESVCQYTLEVKPGYEERFDLMELRALQDLVIEPQLLKTKGVAGVNSCGGVQKQYTVTVDPILLESNGVTLRQVYEAIYENSNGALPGYGKITDQLVSLPGKEPKQNLEAIASFVVDVDGNDPVLIGDVAQVHCIAASSEKVITGNGEGEKVLGRVMMFKGDNSKIVSRVVHESLQKIQNRLPRGVYLNVFLDDADLSGLTISLLLKQIAFGALIVALMLYFLLGCWRSVLVMISLIPLSLLFALSVMYVTGLDIGIMNLGAINFGIIISGTVLSVEYISYKIHVRRHGLLKLGLEERSRARDSLAIDGANRTAKAGLFGPIIILLGFMPVVFMGGMESKLFKPTILPLIYAIGGVVIFGVTYVPAISSLFVKVSEKDHRNMSNRLMVFLKIYYEFALEKVLSYKKAVIGIAFLLLLCVGFLSLRVGADFLSIPDENILVIQPVLDPELSLTESKLMTTRIEKVVKSFPQTRQVVTFAGFGGISNNLFLGNETDMVVTLEPKTQWNTSGSKNELIQQYKQRILDEIPGVKLSVMQPVVPHLNKMAYGTKPGLEIKVFGDSITLLQQKEAQIRAILDRIAGNAETIPEKVSRESEAKIHYLRKALASHGLNISDVNYLVETATEGCIVGSVYEEERRYNLMVRYRPEAGGNIEDILSASIPLPGGGEESLKTFAQIENIGQSPPVYHSNHRRCVVIGVNYRGSNLGAFVDEARTLINTEVDLPIGYAIEFGGQYDEVKSVHHRLKWVVLVALLLIFILLHSAFSDIRLAALVFSVIPFSVVGGMLTLLLFGIPFSTSAGIGFVILFGISTLNGIVLIENYDILKKTSRLDLSMLVIKGSRQKLRPVLMITAGFMFGFFPILLLGGTGIEIQRPLAIVVIGGIFVGTLYTLFVLPVLYTLMERHLRNGYRYMPDWLP